MRRDPLALLWALQGGIDDGVTRLPKSPRRDMNEARARGCPRLSARSHHTLRCSSEWWSPNHGGVVEADENGGEMRVLAYSDCRPWTPLAATIGYCKRLPWDADMASP